MSENKAICKDKEYVLKLNNICKDYYQGRSVIEVLKDVNLTVQAGEIIAIVGASGSGKSTLLHIAGLLDKADSGNISIAGVLDSKITSYKHAHAIRLQNIGFVYQYHHLLPDFTARENVLMPMLIQGCNIKEMTEKADHLLEELGLGKRLYNLPGELSGGEQQRVAIARAMINQPKIILADEPTGNLDPATAEEVFKMFLKMAKEHGSAIVMVTHNMELASRTEKQYKLDYSLQEL
ncbi:MAG: ABC transporter ATP-binding protein [Rickettsiaceae bacterium]|nr:ABC transporter ATP-binding protein [Rickettsiaceae bacterium]